MKVCIVISDYTQVSIFRKNTFLKNSDLFFSKDFAKIFLENPDLILCDEVLFQSFSMYSSKLNRYDITCLVYNLNSLESLSNNVNQFFSLKNKVVLLEKELGYVRDSNTKLLSLSNTDFLTNTFNRRYFDTQFAQEWGRDLRSGDSLGLILVDIDCYKNFNDTYGHLHGDEILIKVSDVLKVSLWRSSDIVCRYGGEEFVIVLPNALKEGVVQVAERIQINLEKLKIPHKGSTVSEYLTVSMGLSSIFPKLDYAPQKLIQCADSALYQAKNQGRNQYVYMDCNNSEFKTENSNKKIFEF